MSEWSQSLTLIQNVDKTSQTLLPPKSTYRPHRRHLTALCPLGAILSARPSASLELSPDLRPPSHAMSVRSLSSLPSTTDKLLTEIPKHRRQWSQRFTPTAYHSTHSNVSSARCGRQLQLLTFNDHVCSASTVDVVSFPGGYWLLSRGHTTLRNSCCLCFPPMLEAYRT